MFRLADQGLVWWPLELVQVTGPGQTEAVTVHLLYRIYSRAELRERERLALERFGARLQGAEGQPRSMEELVGALNAVTEREDGDVDELLDRVRDWSGFDDGTGTCSFSRDRLAAMLEYTPMFRRLREGLFEASREAPAKNSSPGPGSTPVRAQA